MKKIEILAVVGPTASGKSSLGVYLARHYGGEIVSADSMQIYRGMPIAAAVPAPGERNGVAHHLVEILEPWDRCTVAGYKAMAREAIEDIAARGKVPILVGGTGMYIDAVLKDIAFPDQPGDSGVRRELEAEYEKNGAEVMHEKLSAVDPEAAEKIHKNDKKRVLRALEIYRLTGETKTSADVASRPDKTPYECITIGLRFEDRQNLYGRINARVDGMLDRGLLEEARRWYGRVDSRSGAGAAIGHKEFFPFFSGEISYNEAVENLKRATRRYAKRQITWFSGNPDINWITADGGRDVATEARIVIDARRRERRCFQKSLNC